METTPYIASPAKSGVYAWVNLVNRKVYVGSSRNIHKRRSEHIRHLRQGRHHSCHLQAAWGLYGQEAFRFEVLERVDDPLWLEARETAWMLRLQSFYQEFGYNSAHDGWAGASWEPTERRRLAWRLNGKKRRGIKDSPKVRQHKKEGCRNNRPPSRKGLKNSERHKENLSKAWVARRQRGDYYRFTPQDTARGVSAAASKNRLLWTDPVYRASQSRKFRSSWTPERRVEQAKRAGLQMSEAWKHERAVISPQVEGV
jgi:group I intron endonuclease